MTSQLFANFYLSKIDKLIVKRLGELNESAFYLRYMDDLLIAGADKNDICKISGEAIKLAAQRNLEIPIYKRVHLGRDAIPFLGYLVDREMIRPLSRNTRKIKRKLNKLVKANVRESYKQMVKQSFDNWSSLK